ncbi:hypothetical protein DdX_17558 [Ditylenchus destructor]|uniref:DUF155 domain-containing protein n=1 Tax=Ditylenchus destructor TaxID=166010 RepID=A0AAD4MMS6_9BILA|nr:hypothetical protein DdX_17558 [Ditylenchus destructor]
MFSSRISPTKPYMGMPPKPSGKGSKKAAKSRKTARNGNEAMAAQNAESHAVSDFFVFGDGVVVFWNVAQGEQDMVLASLKEYQTDAYSMELSMEESEKIPFNFVTS